MHALTGLYSCSGSTAPAPLRDPGGSGDQGAGGGPPSSKCLTKAMHYAQLTDADLLRGRLDQAAKELTWCPKGAHLVPSSMVHSLTNHSWRSSPGAQQR